MAADMLTNHLVRDLDDHDLSVLHTRNTQNGLVGVACVNPLKKKIRGPAANILFPNDIAIAPPTMTYSAPWLLLAVNQLLDASSSARRCLGDSAGRQRTFIMKFHK